MPASEPLDETTATRHREWWLVFAAFVCIVFMFGVPTMLWPVIYSPIIDEFGWSRTQVTLVATLKFGSGAVLGVLFGVLADRLDIRKIILASGVVCGLSMIGFLLIQTLWHYYLIGLVMGLGSIGVMVAVKVLVSRRFSARQGLAIGSALLGTSVAGTFTPILTSYLIDQVGWRAAVALLSGGIWIVALPVFLRLVGRAEAAPPVEPESTGGPATPEATLGFPQLLRSRTFWLVAVAVFLIGLVDQAVGQHTVLYLDRDLGLGRSAAAGALSLIFFVSIAGKVGFGWCYDKLSITGVMVAYVMMAVAVLLAFPIQGAVTLLAFSVVRGLAHGGAIVDIPVLSRHCFGPRILGLTIGLLTACVTVGFAIGPPLVGYLYDAQGTYRWAFLLLVACSLGAAAALLPVRAVFWEGASARRHAWPPMRVRGGAPVSPTGESSH